MNPDQTMQDIIEGKINPEEALVGIVLLLDHLEVEE